MLVTVDAVVNPSIYLDFADLKKRLPLVRRRVVATRGDAGEWVVIDPSRS
jgi:hypothetical protein